MEAPVNVYTCGLCRGLTVTVEVDEGVTPQIVGCRAKGEGACTGSAQSSWYKVPADAPPADWEWYRPDDAEVKRLKRKSPSLVEHVKHGGLLIRRRRAEHAFILCPLQTSDQHCGYAAIDRHGERCHSVANGTDGEPCGLLREVHAS